MFQYRAQDYIYQRNAPHARQRADAPGSERNRTAAYEQLNAFIEYRWRSGHFETVAFLQGRNLLDRVIRNPVSFLRNYAPEPGRAIEIGLRASF